MNQDRDEQLIALGLHLQHAALARHLHVLGARFRPFEAFEMWSELLAGNGFARRQ